VRRRAGDRKLTGQLPARTNCNRSITHPAFALCYVALRERLSIDAEFTTLSKPAPPASGFARTRVMGALPRQIAHAKGKAPVGAHSFGSRSRAVHRSRGARQLRSRASPISVALQKARNRLRRPERHAACAARAGFSSRPTDLRPRRARPRLGRAARALFAAGFARARSRSTPSPTISRLRAR